MPNKFDEDLQSLFNDNSKPPFLFIGSGFSRRYINLEDWKGLLSKFTSEQPFNYYLSKSNNNIEEAALLLADDFFEEWWKNPKWEASRLEHENSPELSSKSMPLKIEISKYLQTNYSFVNNSELDILKECTIEGVITTNWDCFLEKIFPEYTTFIGQEDLIFSNTYGVGEIYKIHGCVTKPESLILTSKDYEKFRKKNIYLASKLITLFVEHPIIFIGYSLTDSNIQEILTNIVECLSEQQLKQLGENLIFLKRDSQQQGNHISSTSMLLSDSSLPITNIVTNDFSLLFNRMKSIKRKVPAHILRMCKEQLYELIASSTPEKIFANQSDIKKIKSINDLDLIAGIGILKKFGEKGYELADRKDLIEDYINNTHSFNNEHFFDNCLLIKKIGLATNKFLPIFSYIKDNPKYLSHASIKTRIKDIDKLIKLLKSSQTNIPITPITPINIKNAVTNMDFKEIQKIAVNSPTTQKTIKSIMKELRLLSFPLQISTHNWTELAKLCSIIDYLNCQKYLNSQSP